MATTTPSQTLDRTHEERSTRPDNVKDQDATTIGHPKENIVHPASLALPGDRSVYPPNIYAPQAQPFYYRGYGSGGGEWGEYPQYVSHEELEMGSPGVFHTGYGYGPQMPYGPYSPVTTPLPSVGADAQLYSPQQFQFSGPSYYQQLSPAGVPYISSPTPVSQPAMNPLASIDQHGDNMLYGPRPSYPSVGSFDRGSYPGNTGTLGYDLQPGFDGSRSGGLWSDWSKPSGRHSPLVPLSPAVSPQPVVAFGSFGHNAGMAPQHQRSLYGLGSGSNSYGRGYSGFDHGSSFGSAPISSLGVKSRSWLSFENSRQRKRASIPLCGCNGTSLDILSEQNRGPRASKPKSQDAMDVGSIDSNKLTKPPAKIHDETFNKADFVTEYKDAKFFIIKSYSEDNVHKSIKYGVWASTPNGNRKLDNAYREATAEKQEPLPVFLFFSVNASGQFCGVAEMVGPVDFDKSVDYWQQDKWSGQFPVKWHIIKDVPNSQLRHIVLENNDNKPVTNSRDTQEVKVEQGIEMLNIFKNYETEMSILDDFDFYEDRQKAMQERKSRQQASLVSVGIVGETEHENSVTLPSEFIKQMSKSFAQAVQVDESGKEVTITDKSSSVSGGTILAVSSAQDN